MKDILPTGKVAVQNLFADVVGRLARAPGRPRILTFHGIEPADRCPGCSMPAETFELIVRWLHESGYQSVAVAGWRWNEAPSATTSKIVALTFDDAYTSHWECVRPILTRYGMTGTFFVPTSFISGEQETARRSNRGNQRREKFMTWAQVVGLRNLGFEIGSHGSRHVLIGMLDRSEARREIEDSKRELESYLGCPITSFAYPFGREQSYSAATRDLVLAAGYGVACTQMGWAPGPETDLLEVPRTNINGRDNLRRFQLKLDGAYDLWHRLRHAGRRFRGRLRHVSPSIDGPWCH